MKTLFPTLLLALFSLVLVSGCTAPAQQSVPAELSMIAARKNMKEYMRVRDEFIKYAVEKDEQKLHAMMASYGYDRNELSQFFRETIYPFFASYKSTVTPDLFNIVADEEGNVGYSIYGFIETVDGRKKPYAIAILEKGSRLVVKNIVVDRCIKGMHPGCQARE